MAEEKNRWWRLVSALLLALTFALAMASLLNYYKFRNILGELVRDNVAVAAQDIEQSIRLSLSLGLSLSSMQALPTLLERQAGIDPSIISIKVSDTSGRILYAAPPQASAAPLPESWRKAAQLVKAGLWQVEEEKQRVVGWTLRNNFDLPVGSLTIQYSTQDIDSGTQAIFAPLMQRALLVFALAALFGAILVRLVTHLAKRNGRMAWLATSAIMLVTIVALATFSWLAVPLFEHHLLPELKQKAQVIGQAEAALINKAMSHGIALDQLYGVEQKLQQDLAENAGLAFISVIDINGRALFHAARENHREEAAAIAVPLQSAGSLRLGLDPAFTQKLVRELAMDIAVVLIVAFFFTLELLAYLSASTGKSADPLSASRDIRTPAFIFFLSEELTRPFLPNFVAGVADGMSFLPHHLVIGLPIMLFMLIVALSQPWMGAIGQRAGHRQLLIAGACAAIVGFLGCAWCASIYSFLLWRSVCALGYAAIFVSAQGHILDNTDHSNRSAGFALFVGAIMVATICGPSIGGILADNIGPRTTFAVAAALAALAIPFMLRLTKPDRTPQESSENAAQVGFADTLRLLRNRRFVALCLCAAVPAKILLTGYCFYLLPLYVLSIGSTQAMAGRLLMMYAVIMVLLMPLAARYADRRNLRAVFVVAGLSLSALGGLAAMGFLNLWTGLLLVIGLGFGQALSITSQSTLVSSLTPEETASMGHGVVYGVYRLLERLGNAIGPMLAGALLAWFGFQVAFVALGGIALMAAIVFYLLVARNLSSARKRGETA